MVVRKKKNFNSVAVDKKIIISEIEPKQLNKEANFGISAKIIKNTQIKVIYKTKNI